MYALNTAMCHTIYSAQFDAEIHFCDSRDKLRKMQSNTTKAFAHKSQ